MEKLFNWTVGSFFRTIGRLIAYFAIGSIIAYLLANSNLNLGGITNLFFIKVNASTIGDRYQPTMRDDDGNLQEVTNFFRIPISYNSSTGYYSGSKKFYLSNVGVPTGASKVQFNYKYSKNDGFDQSFILYYDSQTEDYRASVGSFSIYFKIIYQDNNNNNYGGICTPVSTYISEEQQFLIECNVPPEATKVAWVEHNINIMPSSYDDGGNYDIFIGNQWQYIIDDSQAITNSIDSQSQQQQQQHNETISIITDTNTTSESNETSNYVLQQQDDTPSGLTSAVTSPLRIIDNAISGSASPLCFNLNGKQSCLPTGSIIWNHQFGEHRWFSSGYSNPLQTFIAFFNLVVAGFLCYKMLISMLRIFNDALDPTISKIEVMKL